mgnify:CR=1 FL=1
MTANEFLNQSKYNPDRDISFEDYHGDEISGVTEQLMVDFARHHVQLALKEALESIPCLGSSTDIPTYKETAEAVLNSYPLNLIK